MMKLTEVKSYLAGHSEEQLRVAITEIYKAIPKSVKESKDIDSIIKNPDDFIQSRQKGAIRQRIPDIESLKSNTETFIQFAKNGYYLSPNSFVSKKERPKWRFTVKRLYKELILSSQYESKLNLATELLEKLYNLLSYSCKYTLFNSYDSFQSVGIEQKNFFNRLLFLKYQIEPKRTFIDNALKLMINNTANRYTLYSSLIEVILSYLKTTDLLEMAIEENDTLLQIEKEKPVSKSADGYSKYEKERNINNLAEFGFYCYAKLFEMDKAIECFKRNWIEFNEEVKLFVLLRLLFSLNQKECFLREYEEAIHKGVKPRRELNKMYHFTKESGQLPEYFGWIE